ncbi:hypothetical protein GCK72_015469 [Caenorhabditis remanei]|uniref:Uncharacterized protein n=1 Tax=Caenorhabditis remanei TaxID=31234 RepID=A0A6A5GWT0_CAERE|nr:hypothetical protein GCK72_015469 [Caenorhabditis remanei]KAF1759009.1 hypothetical protein GCK72_015469 [Caenorhabditis remanei]
MVKVGAISPNIVKNASNRITTTRTIVIMWVEKSIAIAAKFRGKKTTNATDVAGRGHACCVFGHTIPTFCPKLSVVAILVVLVGTWFGWRFHETSTLSTSASLWRRKEMVEPPSPPRHVYELPNEDTDTESEAEYPEEMDQVDNPQIPAKAMKVMMMWFKFDH